MKVLFVGLGNLGAQVLDLFVVHSRGEHQFLVGGRNLDYLRERCRWTASAALQLGFPVQMDATFLDVSNSDQTAQTIAAFKPDVIFSSVTALRSPLLSQLPRPLFERLKEAGGGPRIPLSLVLISKLMQAIKATGLNMIVLNATSPDNVHAVLGKVGLAPTCGIGNLAIAIAPMRQAIATQLHRPLEQVEVRFFAHNHVFHRLKGGTTGEAPFHLTALVNGEDVTTQLDLTALFKTLPLTLEHEYNQLLTAATAVTLFDVLTTKTATIVHAPGPNGLPGAYPLRMGKPGLEVALSGGLTLENAIRINQEGQRFDGIEKIEHDGTVYFAEENMTIFQQVLGYECRRMPFSEVEYWAQELQARYKALEDKHR